MTAEGDSAYVSLSEGEYCVLAGHPSTGPAPTLPGMVSSRWPCRLLNRRKGEWSGLQGQPEENTLCSRPGFGWVGFCLTTKEHKPFRDYHSKRNILEIKGLWAYWSLRTVCHIRVLPDVICDYKLTMMSNYVQQTMAMSTIYKLRFIDNIHIWNSQGLFTRSIHREIQIPCTVFAVISTPGF